jgi:TPR repeat protein
MNNNCEKAFLWFKLATDQRNGEAQFLLGDLMPLEKEPKEMSTLPTNGT